MGDYVRRTNSTAGEFFCHMLVFDAHTHIGEDPLYGAMQFHVRCNTADDLIRSMNEHGINKALTYPPVTSSSISAHEQKKANEFVANQVRRYPERLFGFAVINPRTGKTASGELTRCLKAGLRGLKLWPWGDFNPNAEYVYPLIETCEKFHAPVAIHTDPLDPRCHPLVVADIAAEFPKVTFIHAHMTDPISSLQMIRAATKCKNMVLETSVCSSVSYIEDAITKIGPKRIVWGTDWPFFNAFEIELAKIAVLKASKEEKRLIMGANISRILKLEESP